MGLAVRVNYEASYANKCANLPAHSPEGVQLLLHPLLCTVPRALSKPFSRALDAQSR